MWPKKGETKRGRSSKSGTKSEEAEGLTGSYQCSYEFLFDYGSSEEDEYSKRDRKFRVKRRKRFKKLEHRQNVKQKIDDRKNKILAKIKIKEVLQKKKAERDLRREMVR